MTDQLTLRAEVVRCLSKGMTSAEIGAQLRGRTSCGTVKVTICHARKQLGLEAERGPGKPRKHFAYVRLKEATDRFLRSEADERGITTSELAMRILDKVAADALVDAVLDDGWAK